MLLGFTHTAFLSSLRGHSALSDTNLSPSKCSSAFDTFQTEVPQQCYTWKDVGDALP